MRRVVRANDTAAILAVYALAVARYRLIDSEQQRLSFVAAYWDLTAGEKPATNPAGALVFRCRSQRLGGSLGISHAAQEWARERLRLHDRGPDMPRVSQLDADETSRTDAERRRQLAALQQS